jgi:peptidoglycan-associated lipoprotein
MKLTDFTKLMVLGLVLSLAAPACRKKPGQITPLPSGRTGNVPEATTAPALTGDNNTTGVKAENTGGFVQTDPNLRKNWPRDREIFKSDTVHFDYDSSAVKGPEKSKVSAVADYLKANSMDAVEIEGHCDERGTEEYNRSLGERRALALREQLVSLGVSPDRIDTISYGKDRPADPGHGESAWKQNRRGEFILETPPKQ